MNVRDGVTELAPSEAFAPVQQQVDAGHAIERVLLATFPHAAIVVAFHSNSLKLSVSWTDGPTRNAVGRVIGRTLTNHTRPKIVLKRSCTARLVELIYREANRMEASLMDEGVLCQPLNIPFHVIATALEDRRYLTAYIAGQVRKHGS